MKHTPLRILALGSIVSLGAFVALFTSVHSAQALTISPPSIEFGVQPGQRADLEIKLYNEDTTQSVEVTTETTTWSAGAKAGEPSFQDSKTAEDIAKWIKVGAGPFKLDPQARMNLPVSVEVPADATTGGHYGAILFTFKNPAAPQNGQIAITPKVASLLLVRVDGPDIVESAVISAFGTLNGQTRFSNLPVHFTTTFKNTGNIHLKPKGTITVTNSFGKTVATIDFNTEKGATLPKTTRVYDAEVWQVGTVQALSGNAWKNFWTAFSNERKNFAIGRFTAKAELNAGTLKPFDTSASVIFWVLPWHILVVYGILLIVVIFLLILLVRHYNAWILKRSTPTPPGKPQA